MIMLNRKERMEKETGGFSARHGRGGFTGSAAQISASGMRYFMHPVKRDRERDFRMDLPAAAKI